MSRTTRTVNRRAALGRAGLAGLAAVAALGIAAAGAAAQEKFPSKTIDVVTHAGPGGGTDITTRMMMLKGRRAFGVDMAVVSKQGGGGLAALNYLHGQPRDGYTIMTLTPSHLLAIARGKAPMKFEDLVGLARATDDPQIVMVRKQSPLNTIEDVVKASKDKGLKWGTTFVGGTDHIAVHNFAKAAGVKYEIVPFKGGGEIVTNLVGGNVEVALLNYAEGESQVKAGELRPLAVLAEERIDSLPDVPTAMEKGINTTASTVRGFIALKGIPEDRLAALEKGLVKAMQDPIYQSYLRDGGMPKSSVVGREKWNAQLKRLYDDGKTALQDLGMLK